jgi:hypothetical protein
MTKAIVPGEASQIGRLRPARQKPVPSTYGHSQGCRLFCSGSLSLASRVPSRDERWATDFTYYPPLTRLPRPRLTAIFSNSPGCAPRRQTFRRQEVGQADRRRLDRDQREARSTRRQAAEEIRPRKGSSPQGHRYLVLDIAVRSAVSRKVRSFRAAFFLRRKRAILRNSRASTR